MRNSEFRHDTYGEYYMYLAQLGEDNSEQHTRLVKNLSRAVKEEITPRQRRLLLMYYAEQKNMTEIAAELGVNISTVSRTISRAVTRLRKCLKYGAKELLETEPGPAA